jgi:hypothetical protein
MWCVALRLACRAAVCMSKLDFPRGQTFSRPNTTRRDQIRGRPLLTQRQNLSSIRRKNLRFLLESTMSNTFFTLFTVKSVATNFRNESAVPRVDEQQFSDTHRDNDDVPKATTMCNGATYTFFTLKSVFESFNCDIANIPVVFLDASVFLHRA